MEDVDTRDSNDIKVSTSRTNMKSICVNRSINMMVWLKATYDVIKYQCSTITEYITADDKI